MYSNKYEISLLTNVLSGFAIQTGGLVDRGEYKGFPPFQEGDNKSGSLLMRSGQAPTRTEKSRASGQAPTRTDKSKVAWQSGLALTLFGSVVLSGQDPNRHCYSMLGQCI